MLEGTLSLKPKVKLRKIESALRDQPVKTYMVVMEMSRHVQLCFDFISSS